MCVDVSPVIVSSDEGSVGIGSIFVVGGHLQVDIVFTVQTFIDYAVTVVIFHHVTAMR